MARTPENPNVERVARIPFDKDSVSPMPQIVPRASGAGAGARTRRPETPASTGPDQPPAGEEYPGPAKPRGH
jgi:hypothetical protein